MLANDLAEQAVANSHELGAELARMRRRYGDTGSIDLARYRAIAQLEVLVTATAAIADQMARHESGPIGGNGHAN